MSCLRSKIRSSSWRLSSPPAPEDASASPFCQAPAAGCGRTCVRRQKRSNRHDTATAPCIALAAHPSRTRRTRPDGTGPGQTPPDATSTAFAPARWPPAAPGSRASRRHVSALTRPPLRRSARELPAARPTPALSTCRQAPDSPKPQGLQRKKRAGAGTWRASSVRRRRTPQAGSRVAPDGASRRPMAAVA